MRALLATRAAAPSRIDSVVAQRLAAGLLAAAHLWVAVGAGSAHAQVTDAAVESPPPRGAGSDELLLEPLVPAPPLVVGGGDALALDDVLASVEAHHPALDILDARTDVAEGTLLSAEGAFDPTLTGRGSLSLFGYYEYGRADLLVTQATPVYGASFFAGWRIGRSIDTGGLPEYYGYDETLDGGELRAGVTIPLLRDGWIDGRRAGVTRAEHGVAVAEAELAARTLRVRLAATEAYWRWAAGGRRLVIATALLALAEERDAQLGARVRAGAIPPIEHLENRRAVLERRQAVVTARRALERTAIALSLYLRDDAGAPVVPGIERVPDAIPERPGRAPDEASAIATALDRRPELERFRAARAAAEVAAELADNQVLPRLDVTVSGSVDVGDDAALRSQLSPPVGEGSVVLSFPLLLREARGRADAAHAEVRAIEADLELAADTIAIEVRDALSAIRAAEDATSLAAESASIAEQVAAAERARFAAGASSLLLVNLREVAAAQAAASLVDALADLNLALALLDAVTAAP